MDTEPQYVVVAEADDSDEPVELPCEQDATLLLSTVQAQFPGALGLKYRSPSGNAWRGIRLVESSLHPPAEGWSTTTYIITLPKTDSVKRKMEESPIKEPEAKLVRTSGAASNGEEPTANKNDLIVLGLSYTATESDMRTYFEQFGVVELAEIKNDFRSGKSKGFGFIRFAEKSVAQTVLDKTHEICGRRAEVKKPKGKETPNKLFVGRLPQGTSEEELKSYFECYGETSDVYMPKPHRGFCFITYRDPDDAATVRNLNPPPKLHNNQLNITFAEPKQEQRRESGGFGGSSYGFGDRSDFRSSRGGASGPPSRRGGGRGAGDVYKYNSNNPPTNHQQQDGPFDFEDMMKMFNSAEKMQAFASFMSSENRGRVEQTAPTAVGWPTSLRPDIRSTPPAVAATSVTHQAAAQYYSQQQQQQQPQVGDTTTWNAYYQQQQQQS